MPLQPVGRKEEIDILSSVLRSEKSEFLAVYGRRRVGKTYLIKSYFSSRKDCIFFDVTGSKDGSMAEQIGHFTQRLGEVFLGGVKPRVGKNWDESFAILNDVIKASRSKKIVIFFDELPWMATKNSRLLQSLDYYWNQYWSFDKRVKLVVCGSSASWIINKLINNKGGLHNRVTKYIHLRPFNLRETKLFLHANGVKLNIQQVTQLYMATGGVPFYLQNITKGQTAAQAIEQLAFKQDAFLLKEYDNLFASLFNDPDPYTELLDILSKNKYGLSQKEIIKKSKTISQGGRASSRLKELKEAGFISAFTPYQAKKKGVYYKIIDEYTLFYYSWIAPIRNALQEQSLEKGYWRGIQETAAWHSWSGYAFESICYKHLSQIRRKLDIPVTAIASSWRYVPKKGEAKKGAQIDLLFDRSDQAVTICEIKYTDKPFHITKEYARNLINKGEVFSSQTKNRKQQFITMIVTAGLAENLYSEDLISGVVELADLFKE